jgi:hypothetical protein
MLIINIVEHSSGNPERGHLLGRRYSVPALRLATPRLGHKAKLYALLLSYGHPTPGAGAWA